MKGSTERTDYGDSGDEREEDPDVSFDSVFVRDEEGDRIVLATDRESGSGEDKGTDRERERVTIRSGNKHRRLKALKINRFALQ